MPEAVMPASGTVLAFDFGTKRIGVAVGESTIGLAHPLAGIAGEDTEPRFAAIAKVIAEWKPRHLVVGLPLSIEGAPHELTRRAERFARQLEGRFSLTVSLVDERYTSVDAEDRMRGAGARKPVRDGKQAARSALGIDSAAAQLILQQYFHEHAA